MNTILFRLIFVGSFSFIFAASLLAQNADLYNQASVNAFNDSIVPGTVYIDGGDITDLTPLLMLKSAGNLIIRNTKLNSLFGLDSLKTLNGRLLIEDNRELSNIDALKNLQSINALELIRNASLLQLDGLSGLNGSIDTISLFRTELTELDSLMGLSGDLELLDLQQNELINLNGLIGLTAADELIIHESSLLSLDGLYNLSQSSRVELRLNDIYSLSALAQLDVSESIDLRVSGLVRLDAFYPVRELESLIISNCKTLTDFSGLDSLRHVDQLILHDLMIFTTDVLDFRALKQLSGEMTIVSISQVKDLVDMRIFEEVTSIGRLNLESNSGLQNLVGLDSLKNIDALSIKSCNNMISLAGFPSAEDSLGLLFLSNIEKLQNLDALANLKKLDNTYTFKANFNLERLGISDVDGLSSLSGSYGGFLKILNNDHLQNLDGLGGLSEIGYGIHVQNNSILDSCCVLKDLIQDLEFNLIADNQPYCSWEEISKPDGVCYGDPSTNPDSTAIPDAFSIVKLSPNPASEQVRILYASPEETPMTIRIFDIQGRALAPPQALPILQGYGEYSLPLSRLSPGLYFVQMVEPLFGGIHKLVIY